MSRYLIEVSYKGTRYAGFQLQENANTIQAEVEKALSIFFRKEFHLTGSSRTDAGVHARQNFFHFDADLEDSDGQEAAYHLNAILPEDIVVKRLKRVGDAFHCRFDAVSRSYQYAIYRSKDPFMLDRGYYFPYRLDVELMQEAAGLLLHYRSFGAFSKKHSQVKTFECKLMESSWSETSGGVLMYSVTGNRFLRGMVRGLVGTMLRVGTGKLSMTSFKEIVEGGDQTKADFSAPPQGLFLMRVNFESDSTKSEKK